MPKVKYEYVSKTKLISILQRRLEKDLGGKVSIPNTRLIYKAVMDCILEVLASLKPFQKISLTDWLDAESRFMKGVKMSQGFSRFGKNGERITVDYRPPQSRVCLAIRRHGKQRTKVRYSDEEAAPYIEKLNSFKEGNNESDD